MTASLVDLFDPSAGDPAVVGGKAATLARLLQAGFAVPTACVVPIATDDEAIDGLANELAQRFAGAAVAVRSSAVGEDGATHSFAGQFRSELGVPAEPAALAGAIRRVRASARAVSGHEATSAGSGVAVLVMAMVEPEVAGVAFTRDPVSGERAVVIDAVVGLADALVAGRADGDRWRVDVEPTALSGGGVLDPGLAMAIADLARGVESLEGRPQDVEWAVQDDVVYLLQARPVTALPDEGEQTLGVAGPAIAGEQRPAAGLPVILGRALVKTYRRGSTAIEALREVDLEVAAGEMLVIMGPSGGGKSTLLHLLGGIDRPTSGTLRVAGVDLVAASQPELDRFRRERVGLVFQFFNLLSTASARDNVALGFLARGEGWSQARERASDLLALVGLATRVGHRPAELSGGEQQRVAIARAIAGEPELVLADEPTGDVDSVTARGLMELMAQLNEELGSTFVIVTHNELLTEYATRVAQLHDGRLDG